MGENISCAPNVMLPMQHGTPGPTRLTQSEIGHPGILDEPVAYITIGLDTTGRRKLTRSHLYKLKPNALG